jgi:hypothetical protein
MQSVLIYLPSEAFPLKVYNVDELGLCLVPTNKINPNYGYFHPPYATAFIHYDKKIDIEKTKRLLFNFILFKNFLKTDRDLTEWYLQHPFPGQNEWVNNISSIDNLIKGVIAPNIKEYFTVDYEKFKLLELISNPVEVNFFNLFHKFINLTDSKNEALLRRLIELFAFNASSLRSNKLYSNEYFSISVSFIILEVLVKDEIEDKKKKDICPNCGFESESNRNIKDMISEYIHNTNLIHKDDIELIEKMLHKFADVRNFFFHSGRKVNQERIFDEMKKIKGEVSFNTLDDIEIADGTMMGAWTLQTFLRRILISRLETIRL